MIWWHLDNDGNGSLMVMWCFLMVIWWLYGGDVVAIDNVVNSLW